MLQEIRSTTMDAERRREILERLNAYDAEPTEEDSRAEREAEIERVIEIEDALKWGRISAGGMWGLLGRSASSH
jgi:hypothetical protein